MKLTANTKLRYKIKLINLIDGIKEFIYSLVMVTILFFGMMTLMWTIVNIMFLGVK